jgi:hypothetical protein
MHLWTPQELFTNKEVKKRRFLKSFPQIKSFLQSCFSFLKSISSGHFISSVLFILAIDNIWNVNRATYHIEPFMTFIEPFHILTNLLIVMNVNDIQLSVI